MRTEDVLKATWTGLWRWDSATGASTVDLFTAHLLGIPIRRTDRGSLPLSVEGPGSDSTQESARQGPPEAPPAPGPEPGGHPGTETLTLSETVVRARIQVSDYVDLMANATLSLTEWTMVESVMRVVDEHGSLVRTVRVRMMPTGEGESLALIGTISEVPEPASRPPPGPSRRNGTSRSAARPSC